jgi:hypothetical protein
MRNHRTIFLAIAILVLAGLACNFSQPGQAGPTGEQTVPQGGGGITPEAGGGSDPVDEPASGQPAPTATAAPTATPTPTPIPSRPLGLREGLASLNSYRLQIVMNLSGPTASDISRTTTITEYSQPEDALHVHMETATSTADSPQLENTTIDQYRIGNQSCSLSSDSGEGGDLSEITPLQDEMTTALWGLTDMTVYVEKPVFAGTETVNGVQANHFTFQLSGLGAESGGEVTHSEGEYWLAVDGQYLVKYQVLIEVRSAPQDDPNAEVMRTEFSIVVTDINQPIPISLPAGCQ